MKNDEKIQLEVLKKFKEGLSNLDLDGPDELLLDSYKKKHSYFRNSLEEEMNQLSEKIINLNTHIEEVAGLDHRNILNLDQVKMAEEVRNATNELIQEFNKKRELFNEITDELKAKVEQAKESQEKATKPRPSGGARLK